MIKFKKFGALALAFITCFMFTACGNNNTDVELDESGNVRPGSTVTTVNFWGYGDDVEIQVFNKLVKDFNESNPNIYVKYVQKTSDGYSDNIKTTLGGKKGPDVFYAGDSDYKTLAEYGYLLPLDNYLSKSSEIVPSDMWSSSINRYKYDVNTTTSDGPDAKYWGIPKDIGPTVIYYNETYFKAAGITVISVSEDNLAKFNNSGKDSRGKTKSDYGIKGEVKAKGYFVLDGKKYFNNQISMSWEECVACSRVVQSGSAANYGFFTEWWFNYGWSVGGDCIEYIKSDDTQYNGGYWDFTLMDDTANYIVSDGNSDGFTVNGNKYEAGEIISYQDKLNNVTASVKTVRSEIINACNEGKLNELPSQREAFVEFVRLGQKTNTLVDTVGGQNLYGYGITPSPTSIGGDSGKTLAFANGEIAMLVDGRWNVTNFRDKMDGVYDWDVAPLPQYKEYDAEGDVTVHGVEAGHSGSVALCINKKTSVANAAWKFIEYIGGKTGQTEQSKSGFAIPTQKEIANTEVFLQTDRNPKNSIVFVKAAAYETPGDWWYLRDNLWIDSWAGRLNGDVRNGNLTLSNFEKSSEYTATFATLKTYTKAK